MYVCRNRDKHKHNKRVLHGKLNLTFRITGTTYIQCVW